MKKIVIFDFNRTLYDPDKRDLIPGSIELLQFLRGRGFELELISTAAQSRRELIHEIGIADFFSEVVITQDKNVADFAQIVKKVKPIMTESYVIGDRVRQEIQFGNELGLKTIWIKAGKFSNELPENTNQQPSFTVTSLEEIPSLIEKAL